jgi:hypothetical protein
MADTEDLKSSDLNDHESSTLSSGTKELINAHECLLNTLGASNHYWIKKVYQNAAAYYETWKAKYTKS